MKSMNGHSNATALKPAMLWIAIPVGFALLSFADRSLWEIMRVPKELLPSIESKDWYQLLRQIGYLPTWLIVAGALALTARDASRVTWRFHALPVALSAATSGAIAEILKIIVMRHRPGDDGHYRFAWLLENFDRGPGFGMPSSHAAVAFGGAFMVSYLYRGACWVMMPLAIGCGLTRMIAGAHFATDVYVAAIVGWGVSKGLLRMRDSINARATEHARGIDANN